MSVSVSYQELMCYRTYLIFATETQEFNVCGHSDGNDDDT